MTGPPPPLPREIYNQIFSHLPRADLLSCRLLGRRDSAAHAVATDLAFRHVRLDPVLLLHDYSDDDHGDDDEEDREHVWPQLRKIQHFEMIAQTAHLRDCVREVTVDAAWFWGGFSFPPPCEEMTMTMTGGGAEPYSPTIITHTPSGCLTGVAAAVVPPFLHALPCLRSFPNLRALNLRFSRARQNGLNQEIHTRFRYWVLRVVLEVLAGVWWWDGGGEGEGERKGKGEEKESSRLALDRYCREEWACSWRRYETEEKIDAAAASVLKPPQPPIELHSLTIANLHPDEETQHLVSTSSSSSSPSSSAFQTLIANNTALRELKLLVFLWNPEEEDPSRSRNRNDNNGLYSPVEFDFFESSLPRTWLLLTLPAAQNLRVLSLYARNYWGWYPKIDFRCSEMGRGGGGGGFPNLRTLALGNYVFSHEWQVDWIAGLGGGGGGLEELYLDDCPIMWRARVPGPLDDDGYPRRDVMVAAATTGWAQDDIEDHEYPFRWHVALEHWREHMPSLRVFGMGDGDWEGSEAFSIVQQARLQRPLQEDDLKQRRRRKTHPAERARQDVWRRQRFADRVFLNYDGPQPFTTTTTTTTAATITTTNNPQTTLADFVCDGDGDDDADDMVAVGLENRREQVLQYVHFDVDAGQSPWIERDDRRRAGDLDEVDRYEASRARDERALEELLRVVAERGTGGGREIEMESEHGGR